MKIKNPIKNKVDELKVLVETLKEKKLITNDDLENKKLELKNEKEIKKANK